MEKYFKNEYLLLLLFITSLPAIIYFLNFVCSDIIGTTETWAQFGDFIGGTTSVLLGLINIIVTLFLAITIKNLDTNRIDEQKEIENIRHQQNLDLQQELFLKQIKFNLYNEFNSKIQNLFNNLIFSIDHDTNLLFKRNTNSFYIFLISNKSYFNTFDSKEIQDLKTELTLINEEYESWNNESKNKLKKHAKVFENLIKIIITDLHNELKI